MITIVKHHMQGCSWCKKWDEEVKPYLDPAWTFVQVIGGASSFPTFVIDIDGKTKKLVGFQEMSEIHAAVQELKNGTN